MFWKRLKMSHIIKPWRIVAYLLLLLAPILLMYVAAQASVAAIVLYRAKTQLNQRQQSLPALLQQIQARQLLSLRFPDTALPSLVLVGEQRMEQQRKQAIASFQMAIQNPPELKHSYLAAMAEAVFTPMAQESSGYYVVFHMDPATQGPLAQGAAPVRTEFPYFAPSAALWEVYFDPAFSPLGGAGGGWFGGRSGLVHEISKTLSVAGFWLAALTIGLPLSLVLLPVSLRRAKVRWAHIGRVFLYSLAIPIVLLQATVAAWLICAIGWPMERIDDELWMLPTMFAMPIMLMCWWWAAIRHYLRMPHALAVVVLHAVLCLLVAVAVAFWGSQLLM